MSDAAPAAAWFPDPSDPSRQRWWDGSSWTEHLHPPIAVPPAPAQQPVQQPIIMVAAPQQQFQQHGAPQLHQESVAIAREQLDLQRSQMQLTEQRMDRMDVERERNRKFYLVSWALAFLPNLRR